MNNGRLVGRALEAGQGRTCGEQGRRGNPVGLIAALTTQLTGRESTRPGANLLDLALHLHLELLGRGGRGNASGQPFWCQALQGRQGGLVVRTAERHTRLLGSHGTHKRFGGWLGLHGRNRITCRTIGASTSISRGFISAVGYRKGIIDR